MIALATFLVAGGAAWAHYEFLGRVVISGTPITVWRAWYFAVLIAAAVDIFRVKNEQLRAVWAIMALSYLASFMTWDLSKSPGMDNAARMVAFGGAMLIASRAPAVALSAGLHAVVIFAAIAAYELKLIPDHRQRPAAFLAWSFPDISAGLQHAALLALGLSASMGNFRLDGSYRRGLIDRFRLGNRPVQGMARTPRP